MSKIKRKFTPEDRLSIVQESMREGIAATGRKYNISPSMIGLWKKKYLEKGSSGLKDGYHRVDPQVRQLEEENARLRRVIANQALELDVKNELLKKTPIRTK